MKYGNCNQICLELKEVSILALEMAKKLAERAEVAEKEAEELKQEIKSWENRFKKHQGIFTAIERLQR